MAGEKLYTRSEIEKCDGYGKVLIILHDKVYDVFSFLNEHPGGEEILLDHKGKDSSEDFDDVGHSSDAMELMKKYQVGMLVESERKNKAAKKGWVANYTKVSPNDGNSARFYLLIGALVLIMALLLYKC